MTTHNQANIEATPDSHSLIRPSPFRRAVAWITLIAFIGQPMLATAQVTADQAAAANKRPTIDVTANGIPLVQIATPNAAGLSHNQYTQYNVDPAGVILNNSKTTVLTQQAGYVAGNQNLANGAARIILNEVTSSSRSQLNGYTEVAGQQAEVIIANPNGITCNGCGFINTSRGVLTTGTPVIGSNGSLEALRVTGGDIQIGSAGLNTSSQLDLITRSVQVNGQIWANSLNVITGANQVDYNTLGVQVITGDANKPTIGIDVALLGGMYANKIRLIGTEAGVGVNSLGNLSAQAGDFYLDNAGQITLGGNTTASGNLNINSNTSITNSGLLYSQQNAMLASNGNISNTGMLLAQGNLTFNADSLNSIGTLGSGIDLYGNATQNGNLNITTANKTVATGTNIAGGNLNITAADINLADSTTVAFNDLALIATAGNLNNSNGQIGSGRDLTITVNTLTGNGQVIAGRDANINLQGDYTNASGNVLFAYRDLNFTTSGSLTNQTALEAQNNLTVHAANIYNQAAGSFNSTWTSLNSSGDIVNDGRIDGSSITTNSNNLTNNASIIGNLVTITANNLTNQGDAAIIGATTNLDLWITNQLGNLAGAEIFSMGDLNIAANNVMDANGNYINLTQRILNEGNSLTNSSLIEAWGNIYIGVATLDNRRPTITPTDEVKSVVTKTLTTPTNYVPQEFCLYEGYCISRGNLPYTAADAPIQSGFFAQDMVGLNSDTKSFNLVGGDPYSRAPTVYYESISSTSYDAVQYSNFTTNENDMNVTVHTVIKTADIASSTFGIKSMGDSWSCIEGCYTVTLKNGTVLTFNTLDKQGQYYDVNYYPGYNPNVNIYPKDIQTSGDASETTRTTTTTTTDQVIQAAVPKEAQIRASGNININLGSNGTLNNYLSTITAGGNIVVNGTTTATGDVTNASITNQGLQLNRTVTTNGSSDYVGYVSCGGDLWGGNCAYYFTLPATPVSSIAALSTIPSSITAGNSFVARTRVVTNKTIGGTQTANPAAGNTGSVTLPTSSLYTLHPQPDQKYLVVTDPRFANYQNFISSDYMLSRLSLDPAYTQKRLGDGFYEQTLINDQVTELTGRRFIPPYADAGVEIKALMDSGIAAAGELKLVVGLTLTKDQIAALTSDIVWMVEEQVALPDGSSTKVLVPKVYLTSVHTADLKPNGALIAADVVDINATGTLANTGRINSTTYTVLAANDILNQNGSITSNGDLLLNATHDIRNESGLIGGNNVQLTAGNDILNTTATQTIKYGDAGYGASNMMLADTGTINAANNLGMNAAHDISITGALVQAGGDATLNAGNNLTVGTVAAVATGTVSNGHLQYSAQQTTNLSSNIKTGGDLTLVAANDMHLTAATVDAGKSATLVSGGDLTVDAAKDSNHLNQIYNGDHDYYAADKRDDETVRGSTLNANGNLNLIATQLNADATASATSSSNTGSTGRTDGKGNITLTSATLTSQTGALAVAADADVNIGTTDENHSTFSERHTSSSGFLSSSSSTTRNKTARTDAIGSTLSAEGIAITSKRDLNVSGSDIVGTNDVTLDAANINIKAATSTYSQSSYSHTESSGFMSGGGIGITYGNREQTDQYDQAGTQQSQNRSSIGSVSGNLALTAKNNLTVSGSDLIATQDINLTAQNVTLDTGLDHQTSSESHDFKQSGLTLALSSPVVSAAQTVQQMSSAASKTKDKRMQALAGISAALTSYNAYSKVGEGQALEGGNAADKAGGINVSISLGNSSSHSESQQTSDQRYGTSLSAGNNININAKAGVGEDGTNEPGTGNITAIGSDIKAGNNVSLNADNAINLLAAQNTASQTSSNKSSSNSIGIGFGLGSKSNGFTLDIAASRARGNADGNDAGYSNTHVNAGNQLALKSGGDTTLKGADASGKQINADIGGNLNIESLQDTSTYASQQNSAGFSVSIPIGAGTFSGSINTSNSSANGNYASVTEQSGFYSGDDGFQVNVSNNTDLKGGIIASSDKAIADNKNTLTTASLTSSDLQNRADASASSSGISLSTDMLSQGKYGLAKGVLSNAVNNADATGSSSGQTLSAVSAGTLTITDDSKQQQLTGKTGQETVASLNRDTVNAQTAAQKQDVQTMQQTVEAERAIKNEAFRQVTIQTDAAYIALFKTNTNFYKVTCKVSTDECMKDPSKVTMQPISQEEAKVNGTILAVNGIMNEADRAGQLAYQNAPVDANGDKPDSVTLMHIAPASSGLGEILVAGYEKFLAPTLGYSVADTTYADTLQGRGDKSTLSEGHSRGTIVQINAFNIAADNGYVNKNLTVLGVGGAVGEQTYLDAATRVTQTPANTTFTYMKNDPVSVIAAGNSGDAWAAFKEFANVWANNNSAHSCYGTGAAGCTTIANPISGGPVPTNQQSQNVMTYRGGVLVTPQVSK